MKSEKSTRRMLEQRFKYILLRLKYYTPSHLPKSLIIERDRIEKELGIMYNESK